MSSADRPAVFLDRDGVLNELALNPQNREWESPHRPHEVILRPGAAEAILELARAGFALLVVSNQPSAAKGKCSLADLASVHERILALLGPAAAAAIEGFYYCHHHPEGVVRELTGPCECRKPDPGSLLRASAERGVALARSWMVGDREADVACGRRAGCRTILVRYERTPADPARCRPDHVAADLGAAVEYILSEVRADARR